MGKQGRLKIEDSRLKILTSYLLGGIAQIFRVLRVSFIGLLTLSIFLTGSLTLAQQKDLVVNGQSVAGLRMDLVAGYAYAPAEALAQAFGGSFTFEGGNDATFSYAGRLLGIQVYTSANEAAAATSALSLEGQALTSPGGLNAGQVYLPVRTVAGAFGANAYDPGGGEPIIVVSPRATLERVYRTSGDEGRYERLVLDFSGTASYEEYFNEALGTVQLRFANADARTAQNLNGTYFRQAIVSQRDGLINLRIEGISPDYRSESYVSPTARGVSVIVDIVPRDEPPAIENTPTDTAVLGGSATGRRVVLDPSHGGADLGLRFGADSESALVLDFALRLKTALESRGISVSLTRDEDVGLSVEQRSSHGVGADMFVSLHAATLNPSQYNLYYLGEAAQAAGLELAVQESAAQALSNSDIDGLRRRLLLGLVPNISQGERYASRLQSSFQSASGYRASTQNAAPLSVLEGAAGRGLLLEFNPNDLRDNAAMAEQLAESIVAALR